MRSINKVILIGNLTRDPEMRKTPNDQSVTTFGLATNREWVTKNSDRKNSAEFHECVAWARLAEICETLLKKGSLVYVEGYLKTRSWETPEGTKKFKTEVVVKDMILLEKRASNGDDAADYGYIPEEESSSEYFEEESPSQSFAPEAPAAPVSVQAPEAAPESEPQAKPETSPRSNNPIDQDLGL